MPQSKLIRTVLLVGLSLVAGYIALGIAVAIEPLVLPPVIAPFSPGLKLAEILAPQIGESFSRTFSWSLRIAILTNTLFYFALFSLLSYLIGRCRNPR